MDALDPALYGATPRATAEDVKEFVHRNRLWLGEHIIGPSPAFPPDTVEAFAQKTARDYAVWRKT
ncbi:MAG: hypothetical protein FWF49_06140, partial [Oscillospiraceae bacterium]|nr:hypothetical protein [Oscillospiraceae bacterium]